MQAHSPETGGGESSGTWLLQPDALRGLGGEARLRALLEHPVEPSEGDAATPTVELFEEPAAPQRPVRDDSSRARQRRQWLSHPARNWRAAASATTG